MKSSIVLGKNRISIEDVIQVARSSQSVKLHSIAKKKIKTAFDFLQKKANEDEVIYGVNTGFGLLSNVKIDKKDLKQLQVNLLRSHAVGTGAPLSIEQARAMVFLRAANLSLGHSGVSLRLVEQLLLAVAARGTHMVRCQGCPPELVVTTAMECLHMVLAGDDGGDRGRDWFDRVLHTALSRVDTSDRSDRAQDQRKSRCGRCVTDLLGATMNEILGGNDE